MYGYPPVAKEFKILFEDPDNIVGKERCSKNLNPDSPLVKDLLAKIRSEIKKLYSINDTRPWHVELVDPQLVKGKDPRTKTLERAKSLHGKSIKVKQTDFLFMSSRAFVLRLPTVRGYHKLSHITVAYFDGTEVDEVTRNIVYDIVKKVLSQI